MNPLAKRINAVAFKALGQDVIYRDSNGVGPIIALRILEKNVDVEVKWQNQALSVGQRVILVALGDVETVSRGDRFFIDDKEYGVAVAPKKDLRKGLWVCELGDV